MIEAATRSAQSGAGDGRDREECDQAPPEGRDQATQERLPALRWLLQPDRDRFAHPAEVEFAQLLTCFGVRWAYEPTTFAVKWGSDGRPQEFVTPDFYLPDHELYVELTTMRQRLVTRKNRKFRLLREQYPNIRVKMLYSRDLQRLREAHGPWYPSHAARIGSTLFAEQDVERRVAQLADQLTQGWRIQPRGDGNQKPLLLGVGAGADRFLRSLAAQIDRLGVPVDVDRVELTATTGEHGTTRVRVTRPPVASVAGRPVVIVQEILSTGLTAAFLEAWLRRQGSNGAEVCALLDREAARILDVPIACRGFSAPDVALAGFGLTRWQEYRDLPFIAQIETG